MITTFWKATVCFIMSICIEPLGSYWMDFHEIWYLGIVWKYLDKIQVLCVTIRRGTLYEDPCTFVISLWILLGERNIVSRLYRENQNDNFIVNGFFPQNCAVNEITWKTQSALLHFHCNNGYVNVPQSYIMSTLPVLSF